MNHVERFNAVMNFQDVDRLPMIEWAGWWDVTLLRWHEEGLPEELVEHGPIREHLGLDCYRQLWMGPATEDTPIAPSHGAGICADEAQYEEILPTLYAETPFDPETIEQWGRRQAAGEMVVWISLDGFFWGPRNFLGIERHMYAFYDQPELVHRMNRDILAYNLRAVEKFCEICTPQFMTFGEDMSYNHGPMLSKDTFDEFLAPYYREIVPALKDRGILPLVDSDGDIMPLIPWMAEVGIEGILPLERMAGVDVAEIRRLYPEWRMIGAFDKTIMKDGEAAMRQEFERLLPVMKSGGFIPGVDHQTPPDVSLDTYRTYVDLLREYTQKAAD